MPTAGEDVCLTLRNMPGVRSFLLRAFVIFACAALVLGAAAHVCAQDEDVDLILQLLGDNDKEIRALAFEQIRTAAKGEAATRKFAEVLPTLSADSQLGMLSA